MSVGLFGLQRELKIVKSGIRSIFTPHQPIHSDKLFFGRQDEVSLIIQHINTPGQHSLLYGDRGVGKSSLANIASQLILRNIINGKLYEKRCDSDDTFETILAETLSDCGIDIFACERNITQSEGGNAGLAAPFITAGVKTETQKLIRYNSQAITPSIVAKAFEKYTGLLYIDETDCIKNNDDKRKLSELIKLLSDIGSPFKILVVGVAQTAEELTGAHKSVQRCLKEVKLGRMKDDELRQIIVNGSHQIDFAYTEDVTQAIVKLSSGYPHFTHLIALKCAEEAINDDRKTITIDDLQPALEKSVVEAEGSLKRQYDNATRSYSTVMYKVILQAAARIGGEEFSAEKLRTEVNKITNVHHTQSGLNNFLRRLVSDNGGTVLIRKAKGMYQFTDPRMPSYIRIACGMID